jgi:hypothetical protein
VVGEVERRDAADRRRAERLEAEHGVRVQTLRGADRDHEQGKGADLIRRARHVGADRVGVVEHQQRRPRRLARVFQRALNRRRRPAARRVQHGRPAAVHLLGELGDEPGLADARNAGQRDDRTGVRHGVLPALQQPGELGGAADER